MTFRFQAKYGLLTYAQSDGLCPWKVNDHLSKLGAECIIGLENHADGGTHLHAFFMFSRKFQSRNPRIFDVEGHHPNILRGSKTPGQMYDYAVKDGDVVAGGLERPGDEQVAANSDVFWQAVFDAETRDETFRVARESSVSLLGRYYFQVRAIAEGKTIKNPLDYECDASLAFELGHYPELSDWCSSYLGRRGGRYVMLYHSCLCLSCHLHFVTEALDQILGIDCFGRSVAFRTGRGRGTLRVPTTPNLSPVQGVT